ncbi:MAG: DUF5666 domain-containing protein [Patescibacteria group bacterium]|nr:DUF5666 domain-containing protein [Patescibacteria group bacterium]
MKKNYLITIIAVIVFGAGGFFSGLTYQKSQDSLAGLTGQDLTNKMQSLGLSSGGFGAGRNVNGSISTPNDRDFPDGTSGRQFGGGGMINGEIVGLDSQSITVKQQDGSTKTVYFSTSTEINKTATGSTSDLAVGTTVMANGTSNTDGSITAQNIQLNPAELGSSPTL